MTVDGLEHGQRSSPGNVLQFLVQDEKLPPFDRGLFHVKTTGENKIEADFRNTIYHIKTTTATTNDGFIPK